MAPGHRGPGGPRGPIRPIRPLLSRPIGPCARQLLPITGFLFRLVWNRLCGLRSRNGLVPSRQKGELQPPTGPTGAAQIPFHPAKIKHPPDIIDLALSLSTLDFFHSCFLHLIACAPSFNTKHVRVSYYRLWPVTHHQVSSQNISVLQTHTLLVWRPLAGE